MLVPEEPTESEPELVEQTIKIPAGRILYIEDDPANLTFLERVLERHPGVELVPATAGRVGLEIASQNPPNLVLLTCTSRTWPASTSYAVSTPTRRRPEFRSSP